MNTFNRILIAPLLCLVAVAQASADPQKVVPTSEGSPYLFDRATAVSRAAAALTTLEGWFRWTPCRPYEPWTWGQLCGAGTWAPTLGWGWWNSANALTNTIDYTALSGDPQYLQLVRSAYLLRQDSDYIARDYDDDEGWWALAWIDAFDLFRSQDRGTPKPEAIDYLYRAQFIFNDMAAHWDGTCGGGIWWQKKPEHYKASIANELFFAIAVKLYRRTLDTRYLGWADATYHWLFKDSGLRGADGLIADGLDGAQCAGAAWHGETMTYNQGVVLSGLVEYTDGLPLAKSIADSVLASPRLTRDGILIEAGEKPAAVAATAGTARSSRASSCAAWGSSSAPCRRRTRPRRPTRTSSSATRRRSGNMPATTNGPASRASAPTGPART